MGEAKYLAVHPEGDCYIEVDEGALVYSLTRDMGVAFYPIVLDENNRPGLMEAVHIESTKGMELNKVKIMSGVISFSEAPEKIGGSDE